jgi:hypothetical protein
MEKMIPGTTRELKVGPGLARNMTPLFERVCATVISSQKNLSVAQLKLV